MCTPSCARDVLRQRGAQNEHHAGVAAVVRLYGNDGAHPDLFGDVPVDEAAEVGRLVATLIEMLYILPVAIAKRQAERKP
jgi:hypothetical protein